MVLVWPAVPQLCAQSIRPLAHWTFEGNSWTEDAAGGKKIISSGKLLHKQTEGRVGEYLRLDKTQSDLLRLPIHTTEALTIEFMFRFPQYDYNRFNRLFYFSDYSLFTTIYQEGWQFITKVMDENGQVHTDDMRIPFDGLGKRNFGYYFDGNWHHVVIKFDARKGVKELWVDGELPDGFSKQLPYTGKICAQTPCQKTLYFSHTPAFKANFVGDLDEIVIFDRFVPPALHQLHYFQMRNGRAYTFELPTDTDWQSGIDLDQGNPPDDRPSGIDPREFAPGHPQVKASPVNQLAAFPLPRYKAGHSLMPNFNWMGMRYFGGLMLYRSDPRRAIDASVAIQKELALNWNYMLVIQNTKIARDQQDLERGFFSAWIDLANRYPDLPLGMTTFWPQIHLTDIGEADHRPYIVRNNLPDFYYLKSSSGEFLTRDGRSVRMPSAISPAAPEELIIKDGMAQRHYLQKILSRLHRPVQLINENGEVPPWPYREEVLKKDPRLLRAKLEYEREKEDDTPPEIATRTAPGASDWDLYQAVQKTRLRKAYRDQFMSLPELKQTLFTWYGVDGGPIDRFEWTEARKIHTPIRGQYYATPDFYPRWPDNWRSWKGAFRGLDWIVQSRKKEILAGDRLFSPFVAAGWDKDPEKNIRPSQWLGLLKVLNVMGAEFFYTGFFNVGNNETIFPDPHHYTWQAVMPAYAQAIASRYEEELLEGNLLTDESGMPILEYWAGDPRVPLSIRKHANKSRYVLAATIQPNSNLKGVVPDSTRARVEFNGRVLTFWVRRQGSVYVYDESMGREPVFYQLDGWHETGHPWWWSKDFSFEAEVYDFAYNASMHTEVAPNAPRGDYTNFVTYVSSIKRRRAHLQYTFEPRAEAGNATYSLYIRARSVSGKPTGVKVAVDRRQVGYLTCIRDKNWRWYKLSQCSQLPLRFEAEGGQAHLLELSFVNTALELDQIKIVKQ